MFQLKLLGSMPGIIHNEKFHAKLISTFCLFIDMLESCLFTPINSEPFVYKNMWLDFK